VIFGTLSLAIGVWLAKSRLRAWMKGIWKWPVGDNLTPTVARTLGWANILAAVARPPAIVLILWSRGSSAWLASTLAMFLAGAASFAGIWSVLVSRTKPA
jgi:hypothetical protein